MAEIRSSNTLQAIRNRMVAQIQVIDSTVDVQQGTPVKDIVVDAPSVEFRGNYVVLDYVVRIRNLDAFLDILSDDTYLEDLRDALGFMSTDEVVSMVEADLDDFADTFGITRVAARNALYLQRFYRTDDNSGSSITIPLGNEVKTPDGLVAAVTITSIAQVPTLEATTGLYYVEETVEASSEGTEGNVVLGSMTTMSPRLSITTSTSNVSLIQAGTDIESNDTLVERVKEARKGRNYPTEVGLSQLAVGSLEDSTLNFQDAKVIGPADPLMIRALAGAIDIYAVGKSLSSFQEVIRYEDGQNNYVMGVQPVETISTVVGALAGSISFTQITDVSGAFTGSTRASTSVTITTGALTDQESLTFSYSYDAAIQAAQNLVNDQGQFHVPATDILFRQADLVVIAIDLEIIQFGDRTQADVQADVEGDLAAFFNGGTTSNGVVYPAKEIGENIDRSDIVVLVAAVDDVDRVTLTGPNAMVIYKDGVATTEDVVVIIDNQYTRIGTVTFL